MSDCVPAGLCSHTPIRITPGGLKDGAPCPVHAPQKTWQTLQRCNVKDRHLIKERTPTKISDIMLEAFPVEYSILAPAVGYRVSAGHACIFYAPDLIFIHDRAAALKEVQIYIGDGATLTRSFRSQAWRTSYRACTGSHAAGVVQKGRRAPGDHHSLRFQKLSRAMNASFWRSCVQWSPSPASKRVLPTTG